MPPLKNHAVIAAAGSHKTEFVVTEALAATDKRVLITTYTNENLSCILQRIQSKVGQTPAHITVMSWYQFLATQWCRPYQRPVLGMPGLIRGIDFQSHRPHAIPKASPELYYLNGSGDLYKDYLSDFAASANDKSGGSVVGRLEQLFDEIYVDEVQDLVGYDLEVLDALMQSSIQLCMVGDPRQHTFSTNDNSKNRKYRGAGILDWFDERKSFCDIESRVTSFRCNQAICDLADSLYPGLPKTTSANNDVVEHNGVFHVSKGSAVAYAEAHSPVVLRWSRVSATAGLEAMNFGQAKGTTHEHVLIFPTKEMKKFFVRGDDSGLSEGTRSKLYVAITRAQHSVGYVV